jgi:two-component system, OmpR family, sensor histidine kinase KdpD
MLVAASAVALATGLIYPLKQVAPVVSLGVVYLLAVMLVSIRWGLWLGLLTSLASAAAFNYFHIPPIGRFTIRDPANWVALSTFVVVAIAVSLLGEVARARTAEAEQRRRETDLAAELARLLLGAALLEEALPVAAQRLALAVGVSSASIELRAISGDARRVAFPLFFEGVQIGTLLLSAALSQPERARVAERIVPALESILGAALHRASLQAEVVETAALRRSDEMKTAVLRSVSHDLRTPVTAILTAAAALDPRRPESTGDAKEVLTASAGRLWRLIEKLLDLSLLQAGTIEPRLEWYSIEEVLLEAIDQVHADRDVFKLSLGPDLPLLRGDPGQLERGFANVLENAARHSGGKPVSVRARAVGRRIKVRIVDQGPGIPRSEQERIFMPFYRSPDARDRHQGSGLGLAIAKGFVELNGGRIGVESLPGQGTTFAIEFPLPDRGPGDALLPAPASLVELGR